ncbi:MAG: biopolymer transporter ExbD [Burkholderiales bacterium PBB3]|nr:MAG: biopolymer transporter ExbD [Burkholderiales bacterium PBB3]
MTFGRLERTRGALPMSDINMTPLIDVMLVLLVIFMITAPLMVSKVKVNLPKAAGAASQQVPAFISVVVDKAGQVFVDDKPLDLATVSQRLTEAAAKNATTEVQLRADSAVPYGRIVEVMGLAHQAGLSRIGFVAEAPPQSPQALSLPKP